MLCRSAASGVPIELNRQLFPSRGVVSGAVEFVGSTTYRYLGPETELRS
jgi:hypothetical protein